jgi:hypothetical protein
MEKCVPGIRSLSKPGRYLGTRGPLVHLLSRPRPLSKAVRVGVKLPWRQLNNKMPRLTAVNPAQDSEEIGMWTPSIRFHPP